MKKSPRGILVLAASLLGALLLPKSTAQIAPAATPKDDPVELSPFVVKGDSNVGYAATQTLSGTRLATPLKDTGASVDVLTEEFLNDIGAKNMLDAIDYVANVTRFTGSSDSDSDNNTQWFATSFVSRGFQSNSVGMDFFSTGAIPIDRYNSEYLTIVRGPNSILYGVGNPGGSIGASTKVPRLNGDKYVLKYLIDDYGTNRAEFDLNKVVLPKRLALRVAGVQQEQHTFQKPSLQRREALFGTMTWQPSSATTLTGNAEKGNYDRLFTQNNITGDDYSLWVKAGKPMVNWKAPLANGTIPATPAQAVFPTTPGSGLIRMTSTNDLIAIEGQDIPIQNWRSMATGEQFSIPGSLDNAQIVRTPFGAANSIVPLNVNIMGDSNKIQYNYDRETVILQQRLARNLNLELAWNRLYYKYYYRQALTGGNWIIRPDPNLLLPDGTPNPNAGKAYAETGDVDMKYRESTNVQTYRATLAYQLDLEGLKLFGKFGLGRYTFSGLYEYRDSLNLFQAGTLINTTPLPGYSQDLSATENRIHRRFYLDPANGVYSFRLGPEENINRTPGINAQFRQVSTSVPRYQVEKTDARIAAVQGKLWKSEGGYDRVVGLFGLRADNIETGSRTYTRLAPTGEWMPTFGNLDDNVNFGTSDPKRVNKANTTSRSLIFRPLRAVGLYYNYSDIFVGAGPAFRDFMGRNLVDSYGETTDYGIKFDFLEDKIAGTVTRFETAQNNRSANVSRSPLLTPLLNIWNTLGRNDILDAMGPTPFYYQSDRSKGYEFALSLNPTPSWRFRFTAGNQRTIIQDVAPDVVEHHARYLPEWEKNRSVTLTNGFATGYTTVGDAIDRAKTALADVRSAIGKESAAQREWRYVMTSGYSFREGWLKGARTGVSYRYDSRNVIGFARTTTGLLDINKPFWGSSVAKYDLNVGYSRSLLKRRLVWDLQLNVYNVLNDANVVPKQAVDDTKGNAYITRSMLKQDPRTYQITSTFTY